MIKQPGYRLKWHDSRLSLLEGIFARGDRKVGDLLETAYQLGCRRDGWSEHLRYELWEKAFEKSGVNPNDYLSPFAHPDVPLPWDWIDAGVSRSFLLQERQHALKAEFTPFNCIGNCSDCGLCKTGEISTERAPVDPPADIPGEKPVQSPLAIPAPRDPDPPTARLRLRYCKQGSAVCLSHLETLNFFQRALRRSGLPIYFTLGEHPHPKVAFSPALPVGVESHAEFIDLWFTEALDQQVVMDRLNAVLTEGISFMSVKEVPLNTPSLEKSIAWMEYEFVFDERMLKDLSPDEDLEGMTEIFNTEAPSFTAGSEAFEKITPVLRQATQISVMPGGHGFLCRINKSSGSIPSPMRVVDALLSIYSWNGLKPQIRKIQSSITTSFPSVPLLNKGDRCGQ